MKSYTTLRNLYGDFTKNTNSANLTFGDEIINDTIRDIISKRDWQFLHRLRTATTAASTTFYELPHDMDLIESVFVTVGSTRYNPIPAPDRYFWDQLHYSTYDSDYSEYWIVYDRQLGLWPAPASGSNTISINGKVRVIDLNTADYTTGTVDAITNGSTTVTGDSTVWTSPMAGRWLRVTHSDTAASSGDGVWYEIASVTSNTALELVRNYNGTTLASAAGASYTIGQMPQLPENFHDLPVYRAAAIYWYKENDISRADQFIKIYEDRLEKLFGQYSDEESNMVVDAGEDQRLINPNLTIEL